MTLQVLGIFPDWSVIFIIAGVFAFAALQINKRWGNRKRVKEIQKQLKEFQKEMAEAQKNKDEAKIKEMAARDHDMSGMMQDMMIAPIKAMVIILPVFFIFVSIAPWLFPKFTIALPVGLHISQIFSLRILEQTTYGARGFFIISSAIWGFILEAIQSQSEKRKQKSATTAQPTTTG